jgi:hypothetical protein
MLHLEKKYIHTGQTEILCSHLQAQIEEEKRKKRKRDQNVP